MNAALTLFRFKNQLSGIIAPQYTAQKMATMFLNPKKNPLKAWEEQAENNGKRFTINEHISAITWDAKDHKNPKRLLLIHGWESRATQMYGLVPELLQQGYQVTALDMPMHGHTQGDKSNPFIFAQTVLMAQQALGEFDAVIAHSMGAGATAATLNENDSLPGQLNTQKVILIAGPSSIENVLRHFARLVGLTKRTTRYFLNEVERNVGVSTHKLDVLSAPQKINTHTLIVHDEHDLEVPFSEAQRMVKGFNHAELLATKGLGHRQILRSDIIKEKMCEFLASPLPTSVTH